MRRVLPLALALASLPAAAQLAIPTARDATQSCPRQFVSAVARHEAVFLFQTFPPSAVNGTARLVVPHGTPLGQAGWTFQCVNYGGNPTGTVFCDTDNTTPDSVVACTLTNALQPRECRFTLDVSAVQAVAFDAGVTFFGSLNGSTSIGGGVTLPVQSINEADYLWSGGFDGEPSPLDATCALY